LEEAAKVAPNVRFRFTSPHPKDFPDKVDLNRLGFGCDCKISKYLQINTYASISWKYRNFI